MVWIEKKDLKDVEETINHALYADMEDYESGDIAVSHSIECANGECTTTEDEIDDLIKEYYSDKLESEELHSKRFRGYINDTEDFHDLSDELYVRELLKKGMEITICNDPTLSMQGSTTYTPRGDFIDEFSEGSKWRDQVPSERSHERAAEKIYNSLDKACCWPGTEDFTRATIKTGV